MPLTLIVAVASNGVIGRNGALPWRLPEDLRRFRSITTGHAIVMGRRTWDSLGHPLPGRQNIVVTRQSGWRADDATAASSIADALAKVARPAPVFCIGGGELFRAALPHAQTAYVTEIGRAYEGDAAFAPLDPSLWRETSREAHVHEGDDAFPYAFVTYERAGPTQSRIPKAQREGPMSADDHLLA